MPSASCIMEERRRHRFNHQPCRRRDRIRILADDERYDERQDEWKDARHRTTHLASRTRMRRPAAPGWGSRAPGVSRALRACSSWALPRRVRCRRRPVAVVHHRQPFSDTRWWRVVDVFSSSRQGTFRPSPAHQQSGRSGGSVERIKMAAGRRNDAVTVKVSVMGLASLAGRDTRRSCRGRGRRSRASGRGSR